MAESIAEDLIATLDAGGTVVTVNRRLARHLAAAHDRTRIARGELCWPTPDVLPYDAWLTRCWIRLADRLPAGGEPVPRLLDAAQEAALWERAMESAGARERLLAFSNAVPRVREAWDLLREWDVDWPRAAGPLDEDAAAFEDWRREYEARRRAGGWLDRAALVDWLLPRLDRDDWPRPMVWAGFDRLSPRQTRLGQALARRGVAVTLWTPPVRSPAAVRLELPDPEAELAAAARWTREILIRQPEARLAVIHPRLDAVRGLITRLFTDCLHPGRAGRAGETGHPLFNISLGSPLADHPLIHDLLLLLETLRPRFALAVAGGVLLSPFTRGGVTERSARAGLDARLRRERRPTADRVRLAA
ncbi:MAG: hypothetical protein HQL82_13910, partial [Magnetococcales bacterium]|nr:hypothetical protein [Magnetococcales bacterium]